MDSWEHVESNIQTTVRHRHRHTAIGEEASLFDSESDEEKNLYGVQYESYILTIRTLYAPTGQEL